MRVLRYVAAVMAAVLMVSLLGACGDEDDGGGGGGGGEAAQEGPPAQPLKIRMGWGIPAEEIKYVMMNQPELAQNMGTWYDIEWRQFAGTALGVQGLAAGTLDCATVGGLSVANGLDQGAEITIMGQMLEERSGAYSTTWLAKADSGIDSLEKLRGKRVATSAVGGSTDYIQDIHIEQETGMKADEDYEKVEVPFGQMVESLLANRIDVGVFPQPFYGAVSSETETNDLFTVVDVIDPFVQLLNACRTEFVGENRAVLQKFQEDWQRIGDWILEQENRDAVIEASSTATEIPAKIFQSFLLTQRDYTRLPGGALNVEALQNEWDFFREAGGIEQDHQVQDYIDDLTVTSDEVGEIPELPAAPPGDDGGGSGSESDGGS